MLTLANSEGRIQLVLRNGSDQNIEENAQPRNGRVVRRRALQTQESGAGSLQRPPVEAA